MRLSVLEEPRPSEIRDSALAPEEEVVRAQDEIVRLKLRIEELEAMRDEAIALALKNGIKVYGGYRFAEKKPASSLSDRKLATAYPEVLDGFIKWYHETHEAKLTKVELKRYLEFSGNTNPDKVIADITVPGKGESTVTITKLKEGSH